MENWFRNGEELTDKELLNIQAKEEYALLKDEMDIEIQLGKYEHECGPVKTYKISELA